MSGWAWAADYVGLPWRAGAAGPEAFDCWGLFRHVQAAHFDRQVPVILAADYDDPAVLASLFLHHGERARWARVEAPEPGDAVIVHRPLHVGIWLPADGGGVLHAVRGAGVIYTREAAWRLSGFGRREFYGFAP
jgi:cell wall-associated NlpC family hydrolase